jgi:hypothetical protein
MQTNMQELLKRYGFTRPPCGPWRRVKPDSNYSEYDLVIIYSDRPGFAVETHGTYPDGDNGFYQDKDRTTSRPGQSFEDFMLQEFGPVPEKKTYSREEVIALLEDVYAETSGSHNDYGNSTEDYRDDAAIYVRSYMATR